MNAFCRTDWELPISLSRNFSKLVSAAMSLPLIALSWASISFISRVCVAMTVRNASCTLVDCSCSSLTSAVSASIWASLVTWSGCFHGRSR